jgi:hypothetical protein
MVRSFSKYYPPVYSTVATRWLTFEAKSSSCCKCNFEALHTYETYRLCYKALRIVSKDWPIYDTHIYMWEEYSFTALKNYIILQSDRKTNKPVENLSEFGSELLEISPEIGTSLSIGHK